MTPITVGIAGGSGSGKSTLVARLLSELGSGRANRLELDCYYRDQSALPPELRSGLNYDHPDQIDWALFGTQLRSLLAGSPIEVPRYDFSTHTRATGTDQLHPASIVLIDGILLFHLPEIRDLLRLRVYLEVDDDIRLARRLSRDVRERGRTLDSVLAQYFGSVRPMHRRYVEPTRRFAHLVIPPDLPLEAAASRILDAISGQ